jgi:Uma2 family endonuclease
MCALEYYTYDDYKTWEGKWELIYGQPLAMAPSPVISHQVVAFQIAKQLDKNIKCEECLVVLEEDWKIDEDSVVKPDVALICEEGDFITKAPEVVVEVISKSTARRDEKIKFEIYEKEKVKYYILAYPTDLKAKVYRLDGKAFDKVGDFTNEEVELTDIKCPTKIDFNEVFKRFRKGD